MAKAFSGLVNDRLDRLFPEQNYLMQQLLEDSRGILGLLKVLLSRADLLNTEYSSLLSIFHSKLTQVLEGTYVTILAEFFGTEEELEALFLNLRRTVTQGKIVLRKILLDFPGVTFILKNALDSVALAQEDKTEMLAVILSLGINTIVFD